MKKRIRLYIVSITTLALLVFFCSGLVWIRDRFENSARQSLDNYLSVAVSLEEQPPAEDELQEWLRQLSRSLAGGVRITVADRQGTVLADSAAQAQAMPNHLDRPEFSAALEQGRGEAVRPSETTGVRTMYVAGSWGDEYLVRFAMPVAAATEFIYSLLPGLLGLVILTFFFTILFSNYVSEKITAPYDKIFAAIEQALQSRDPDTILEAEYEEMEPVVRYFRTVLHQISDYINQISAKTEEIESITGAMEEGLVMLDSDEAIVSINAQASRLMGIPQSTWQKKITWLYREKEFARMLREMRQTGKRQVIDIRDKGRILRFYANPAAEGGAVMLISDVTEIKRLEQMRSDFAANVSHELKTPLTSISGFAELIETGMVQDAALLREYAGKIHTESKRLMLLIEDILRLSSIENGVQEGEEPVAVEEVFRYALEMLDAQRRERELTITLEGSLTVLASRERLYELAFNLVDNAIKYNRQGGTVAIALNGSGFWVENTGEEIPPEHQPRIFERFYRVDKARSRATGGTGLGLSIARHIVGLYEGMIEVSSQKGRTRFTVSFPDSRILHTKQG